MYTPLLIGIGILVPALLALGIWAVHFIWGVDSASGPRTLAQVTAAGGTEFRLVQTPNHHLDEPFTTAIYCRKPRRNWGRVYYDQQDLYWGRARIQMDPVAKRITIFRCGKRVLTFDWESGACRKWEGGVVDRTVTKPEIEMPDSWEPPP